MTPAGSYQAWIVWTHGVRPYPIRVSHLAPFGNGFLTPSPKFELQLGARSGWEFSIRIHSFFSGTNPISFHSLLGKIPPSQIFSPVFFTSLFHVLNQLRTPMPNSPPTPNSFAPAGSQNRPRRGAQPGNHNALKRGIYSAQIKPKELGDASELSTVGLSDEIIPLRVFIRRLLAASSDTTEQKELIVVLHELRLAKFTLTRLVKT
jgi:hypothetical protein